MVEALRQGAVHLGMVDPLSATSGEAPGRRATRHPYPAGVEQRISLVTLGVADVARARRFYEALGWRGQEVEETVFFQTGGMALVLWSGTALAEDAGVAPGDPAAFRGVALAHNVRTREEVDAVVATASEAGATVTQAPRSTSYGAMPATSVIRMATCGRWPTTPASPSGRTAPSPCRISADPSCAG